MIVEKVRVFVETNTNIKFVVSLPSTLTIRTVLPILLKNYDAVVRQNFDQEEYNLQALKVNHIKQITKNGYFIPLDEKINSILTNDDNIFIETKLYEDRKQTKLNKKETLEIKKSEKQIDQKHSDKKVANKRGQKDEKDKIDQVIHKKPEKQQIIPISKEGQTNKKKTEENLISKQDFSRLLSKIKINKSISSPSTEKPRKTIIVQEPDSEDE